MLTCQALRIPTTEKKTLYFFRHTPSNQVYIHFQPITQKERSKEHKFLQPSNNHLKRGIARESENALPNGMGNIITFCCNCSRRTWLSANFNYSTQKHKQFDLLKKCFEVIKLDENRSGSSRRSSVIQGLLTALSCQFCNSLFTKQNMLTLKGENLHKN